MCCFRPSDKRLCKPSGTPRTCKCIVCPCTSSSVVLLVVFSLYVPSVKMSVATAMLIGSVYAMAVTRTNPEKVTKEFFNGMGKGYANILGIIIAAGVFAAGLRAAGVVDSFVAFLTQTQGAAKSAGLSVRTS